LKTTSKLIDFKYYTELDNVALKYDKHIKSNIYLTSNCALGQSDA